jgi:HKD family nuclease
MPSIGSPLEIDAVSSQIFFVTNSTGVQYLHSFRELLVGARSVDIAVSYVKLGGWQLVQKEFARAGIGASAIRVIATSQLGITQPQAVDAIRKSGAMIRNYFGRRVFHAKVIVAYDDSGAAMGAIVGSANLSESALNRAVECGIRTTDRSVLEELRAWFDSLIADDRQTREFSDADLQFLKETWKTSSALRLRQSLRAPITVARSGLLKADPEALEDLFVSVTLPIATLNVDHAGNNIRNLRHLLEVLHAFPRSSGNLRVETKQRSDLRLLGLLAHGKALTALGKDARRCKSETELARLWCNWASRASDADLDAINPRISAFKRAADRFWMLQDAVRRFFFDNRMQTAQRRTLQAIELFCNASDVVSGLEIDDFRRLARAIESPDLPNALRTAARDYFNNKGGRTWRDDDRRIMLEAWRAVRQ